METLTINKANALKAFNNATTEGKKMLSNLFGEKVLSEKITDRIKSFDHALEICPASENLKILLKYNGIDRDMIASQAFAKMSIIARALNEGWKPDWTNGNELKYYPYFEMTKSGFGFSCTGYDFWDTRTTVGSRLCFKTSELAEYAGKQFETIYNDFLNL